MSAGEKRAVRVAAKAALQAAAHFQRFKVISAWSKTVDVQSLPAIGIATPDEQGQDRETHDVGRRLLSLVVIVKRVGGAEIEDLLDDDADAVEVAIKAAIRLPHRMCDLQRSAVRIDEEGGQRVGTLEQTFTVTYWIDEDPA